LQLFGWRLLHGAMVCGAWRAPYASQADLRGECCCSAPCCVAVVADDPAELPLETYTHMFVTCPAVKPAVAWLRGVSGLILGGGGGAPLPPVAVILGEGQPSGGGAGASELCHHVRLRLLHAVWRARCVRAAAPEGTAAPHLGAAAIVAMAVAAIEQDIRRDWHRVQHDVRLQAGVSAAMFAGHADPMLPLSEFERRWCVGGVLASVAGGPGGERLVVSIPRALPMPAPAGT
jgi:hypothetical protein